MDSHKRCDLCVSVAHSYHQCTIGKDFLNMEHVQEDAQKVDEFLGRPDGVPVAKWVEKEKNPKYWNIYAQITTGYGHFLEESFYGTAEKYSYFDHVVNKVEFKPGWS